MTAHGLSNLITLPKAVFAVWWRKEGEEDCLLIFLSLFQAFMIATLIKDYAEVLRETMGNTAVSGSGGPPSGLMAAPVPQDGVPPPEVRRSRPPSIMARPPPTLTEEVVTQ